MKIKYPLFFILFAITLNSCNKLTQEEARQLTIELSKVETILVVTVSGSSDMEIHSEIIRQADEVGYSLHTGPIPVNINGAVEMQPGNWFLYKGGVYASDADQAELASAIQTLIDQNGGDRNKMSLLVVGKSLGAVLSWATLMNYEGIVFSGFRRVALVLIDPHGAARSDESNSAYRKGHPLYWPDSFPDNTGFFRLYHIFQQDDTPTGAAFLKPVSEDRWVAEERVCRSIDLSGREDIDHNEMVQQPESKAMIGEALRFVWYGEDWWQEENPCDYD